MTSTPCPPLRGVRWPLAGSASWEQVVRAAGSGSGLCSADGLVALVGDWAGGSPLLTCDPVRTATSLDVLDELPAVTTTQDGLIGGGWFGWLACDGAVRLALHDHVVRRIGGRWHIEALWDEAADARLRGLREHWQQVLHAASDVRPQGQGQPREQEWTLGSVTGAERQPHLCAVERAVELIRAGELYQVNVCTRLRADFSGSPAALFADVAGALRPARGALVSSAGRTVASLSPELFLHLRGRDVRTAPIKGTLPRGEGTGEGAGQGNAARLRASAKDVAENVMIVDLMRNDLGRVSRAGTVRVPALLEVEAHPGVWHLVSTVTGQLRDDITTAGLLAATFPPGSVTGAPKMRATEAIAELETADRGVYTGAIGFVSPLAGAEFSVAIRTFEVQDGRLELGVGGGVTADSVPMLEWRECLHKAAPLLRAAGVPVPLPPLARRPVTVASPALLETVLVRNGRPLRLADHLARLDRSSRELFDRGLPPDVRGKVEAALAGLVAPRVALRLVLAPDGRLSVDATVLDPPPPAGEAGSRLVVRHRASGLWRHKWADRAELIEHERSALPDSPLFLDADGAVSETSRGSIFLVRPDGGLVTPPLGDDLLPGVTRRAVLDLARDAGRPTELRPLTLAELRGAPAFWTSSLSGAVPIHSVDGVALPRADALVAELGGAIGCR